MDRVLGIGGIFFKARDAKALREWYRVHLGIDVQVWGGANFRWGYSDAVEAQGETVWNIFEGDSTYFAPSEAKFMVNYRVRDLDALIVALRAEGCDVDEKVERSEYGKFGWVMDPEGNRIELWEPPVNGTPG